MGTTPRYGIDGWPYVFGLTVGAAGLSAVAASARRRRVLSIAAALGAGGCAIPAALGWHYTVAGKSALRDSMLDEISWEGTEDVVDLGAGAGLLGLGAAGRTKGRIHAVDLFIAKDLSGNTPQRLRRNATLLGVGDRVDIHRSDVRSTGLPNDCADVILSSLCLHNLPNPGNRRRAIEEMARLLRPAGTIVISDLAHVDDEYAPALIELGFSVRTRRAAATFPPQKVLVATDERR